MPPCPSLAVHFAENVVQQHVRRTGRVGAREIADHRIEAKCGLDRLRLEPAVEQVAGALGEKIQHVPSLGQRQPLQPAADFPRPQPIGDAAADVGRRFEQQRPQHVADAAKHRVVLRQRCRISSREARDLGLRRGQAAADFQAIA